MYKIFIFLALFPLFASGQFTNDYRIEVTDNSDIILFSEHGGSIEIDGQLYGDSLTENFIVTKFDSEGNNLWVTNLDIDLINCGGRCPSIGFEVDSEGSTYLSIPFFRFDIDGQSHISSTNKSFLPAVVKISSSGEVLWYKVMEGEAGFSDRTQMEVAENGDVYMSFRFIGTVEIDNFTLESPFLSIAIMKMNSNGNVLSVQKLLGSADAAGNINVNSLILDSSNGFYVTGSFTETMSANSIEYTDLDGSSIFTCKFNESMEISWFETLIGLNYEFQDGMHCHLNSEESIVYLTGNFRGPLLISEGDTIEYNGAHSESFLLSYNTTDGSILGYNSFSEGMNGDVSEDNFSLVLLNLANGALYNEESLDVDPDNESLVLILDQEQLPSCIFEQTQQIQNSVLHEENVYFVSKGDWIEEVIGFSNSIIISKGNVNDCTLGWELELPLYNGNIPVEISSDDFGNEISFSPNPASDILTINRSSKFEDINISIYDQNGRKVLTKNIDGEISQIDLPSNIISGIYSVVITSEGKVAVKKLVVE